MTPLRAFFRHFREAMSRASVSVGGVSICFDRAARPSAGADSRGMDRSAAVD